MAEAVVSVALGTLRDLLEEQVRFLYGVSGEVKALEKQLKEMKCLLADADRRKFESQTVGNWISEIRDLAYRAEDVIETYAFKVASTRRGGFLKRILRRFACALKDGYNIHQIGSEILEIKSELATVTKSMENYGIRNIIQGESSTNPVNDENQRWKRMTSPFERSEDCFVGKDEELKSLVSLVVKDEQQRLITIWGMGGIGKTTIAGKVYNHSDVKRSFECFAWVCISQQCQIRSVLEDVLKQLNPTVREQITTLSETELIGELSEIQRNKRCFIVLDDVWKVDHWDGLKHGFLVQGSRSKVMVTTRTKDVAAKGCMKEIGLLNDDDGLELLKKKAFANNRIFPEVMNEGNMIEEIGKGMVKRCGNLPLAISLLGGVLSQKTSMEDWKSIEQNMSTSLQGESEMQGVLYLSYDDLPHYLKPCFLYMGLLKEDESVYGNDLCNMWIAQGMVTYENKKKDNTLMDIAKLYLSELVSRCLVQPQYGGLFDDSTYGGWYQLHDVVQELCLSKGKEEDFGLYSVDYQGGNADNLWDESLRSVKARHLAINFKEEINPQCISMTENIGKRIRSLLLVNKTMWSKIEIPKSAFHDIDEFKLLKVLVFFQSSFEGGKFPRTIGNLIHLRELRLVECELDELPSSICNLRYLIILDLERSWNVQLPSNMKKMSRLKYLRLPHFEIEKYRNNHISLEGLDELEELRGFVSQMFDFKSIIRMKNLRVLVANIYDDESLSSIIDAVTHHWKSLHTFHLQIGDGCKLTLTGSEGLITLKKVFTCHVLDSLKICTHIGPLLEKVTTQMLSSSLKSLFLKKCGIEKDPMKMLGQIPSLKFLTMEDNSFTGENMICNASIFPKLKVLRLSGLPNLREWEVEQGAMSLLSVIYIEHCSELMMIPEGFRFLKSLKVLYIEGMPEMGRRVSLEGEDYDKVRHVPVILI